MKPKFWTVYSGKYTKKWYDCLCKHVHIIYLFSLYIKNRFDSIKEQDVLLANTPKHS